MCWLFGKKAMKEEKAIPEAEVTYHDLVKTFDELPFDITMFGG